MKGTLASIVSILNDGQIHDGTSMGLALGITRSAIWKGVKKLLAYGLPIESVKGKGYRIKETMILLDKKILHAGISHSAIQLSLFETLKTTNDFRLFNQATSRQVCLSEHVSAAKGRLQRRWYAPFGLNIYLSFFYLFKRDISELSGLSLVVSLAIREAIRKSDLSCHLQVKWPNDIVFEGKKLSGHLIEIRAESNGSCQAIIGIGLNVNMVQDNDRSITQPWTS